MINNTLSPEAYQALKACLNKAGPRKGLLGVKAPSYAKNPEAHAAWHAAMLSINPYKVSMVSLMFNSRTPALQAIAMEITTFFDAHPELRHMDRDRSALERLGVW